MTGFIAMQRDALDHPVLHDAERFRAWFWLVANAAWKPTRVRIKGQIVTLERGQVSFSQRFMAEAWGWSKSRVDRFIGELRDEGMIETCSKNGATSSHAAGQGQAILTICNYCKYQSPSLNERGNIEAQDGATAGQRRGKEEQVNNIKHTKAHAIPANWWPKEFGKNTKSRNTVDSWSRDELAEQVERFTAHHTKVGSKFDCWQSAWSTWVLNSKNFKPRQAPAQQQRGSSLAEIGNEVRQLYGY